MVRIGIVGVGFMGGHCGHCSQELGGALLAATDDAGEQLVKPFAQEPHGVAHADHLVQHRLRGGNGGIGLGD